MVKVTEVAGVTATPTRFSAELNHHPGGERTQGREFDQALTAWQAALKRTPTTPGLLCVWGHLLATRPHGRYRNTKQALWTGPRIGSGPALAGTLGCGR